MKKITLLLFYLLSWSSLMAQLVNYSVSNEIIANPERGLQKYSITAANYHSTAGANNISVATLNSWKNSSDKVTVVYRCFLLNAFMNSSINTTYLNNMQNDFNNIRNAGLKVIVRFSYSDTQSNSIAQQPSKALILVHINQLSALLNSNKDIIFSHQAGFIGTYGEWYYTNSTEFGTSGVISGTQWANRKEILDAMLNATPVGIPIQVRTVGIKTTMYGTTQLSSTTAYQNNANARIGFYNDAFLNKWGDMGTYNAGECDNPVGTIEYNYLSNETKYLPMSGETNGLNDCNNGFRTMGSNAIDEMGLTNWTTINRDYSLDFWNQLTTIQYNDIIKKLGYRFTMNSSMLTPGSSSFNLNISITNLGFATPFKQRDVYLVMKNTATNAISTYLINTDIRTWENSVVINQNFTPNLIGTFQLYLWLPDREPGLINNSDYSIQFSNTGIWEQTTGYNNLLQTVTLSTLGTSEEIMAQTAVYPNPASDYVIFQQNIDDVSRIYIYNSFGQLIKEVNGSNNVRIDVSELSSGIYFIRSGMSSSIVKLIKK